MTLGEANYINQQIAQGKLDAGICYDDGNFKYKYTGRIEEYYTAFDLEMKELVRVNGKMRIRHSK